MVRSSTMRRSQAQQDRQPRNAVTGEPSGGLGVTGLAPDATEALAGIMPSLGNNVFVLSASGQDDKTLAKMNAMSTAREELKEANVLFSKGADEATNATELAGQAALRLYQARTNGWASSEELTALLGDVFGYKAKGGAKQAGANAKAPGPLSASDPKRSATPFGQGEVIRKRVVRAVAAAEYVANGDGGRFFEGLPEKKVEDIVHRLNEGEIAVFTAYDVLANLKRESAGERVNPAFDVKRISAIVDALSEPAARDKVLGNRELVTAYGALLKMILILGEQPTETEKEEKAA